MLLRKRRLRVPTLKSPVVRRICPPCAQPPFLSKRFLRAARDRRHGQRRRAKTGTARRAALAADRRPQTAGSRPRARARRMIVMHHSRNAPLRERAHAVHAALAAYRRCTSAQITQRCGGGAPLCGHAQRPFLHAVAPPTQIPPNTCVLDRPAINSPHRSAGFLFISLVLDAREVALLALPIPLLHPLIGAERVRVPGLMIERRRVIARQTAHKSG